MAVILVVMLASCGAFGQHRLTLSGPASARPGTTITIPVTLSGGTGAAALQWTLTMPNSWSASQSIGPAATAAGKDRLSCHSTGICLLYGLNQTNIADGIVASYQVQIPPSATPGPVVLPLTDVLAASGSGAAVSITAGAAYSVRILARSDIDGDGSTTVSDIALMDAQARGAAACADDQNGDGRCSIYDVVLVIVDYLRGLGQ